MARKRNRLPNGVRFEVFKRDKFRCQYCGAAAPDAVLQVDHIDPVANGGTDDLTNLVTSCATCNSGKSDKLLSDDSAVAKQRAELERQQERLEQIEMIAQWRASLADVEERALEVAVKEFQRGVGDQVNLTDRGARDMRRRIRKHGLEAVCESIAWCIERAGDDPELILESLDGALGFMRAVADDPQERDAYYIRGWVARAHGMEKDRQLLEDVHRWITNGWPVQTIKDWIDKADSFEQLDEWFSRNTHQLQGEAQ